MKLLIMILCIALERYGERFDHYRQFGWFEAWAKTLETKLYFVHPGIVLIATISPVLIVVWLFFALFGGWIFGSVGLVAEIAVVFYCLGPRNIFQYRKLKLEHEMPENYVSQVNRDYFAVMCWYLVFGLKGALCYRLLDRIAVSTRGSHPLAVTVMNYLDWIPARLLGLCYLMVGNFQQVFPFMLANCWSAADKNEFFLTECGMLAVKQEGKGGVTLSQAEQLVWYALVFFFVVIALLTMAAWL
ncbi:MAG: regulatory signaling modulator protein AmpE [Gammaproteobacteria bacterium]|nr:regulatory signaling modulator protein AmpE [Gammaproteobacteria bacterium]